MDVTKQLHEYEVEYHVLQEEMSSPRPETEKIRQLNQENKQLQEQLEVCFPKLKQTEGMECFSEDGQTYPFVNFYLQISSSNMRRLETSRTHQQAQLNRLESQVRSLEVSISTLGGFISTLIENHKDIEIPGDVRRLVAQLSAPGPDRRKNSGNLGLGNILKPRHDPPNTMKPDPKHDSKHSLNLSKNDPMARTKSDPPRMIPTPRSFPLKVIEDDDRYESNLRPTLSLQNGSTINSMNSKVASGRPYPLKSAASSPNLTSKMSSFFQKVQGPQLEQRMNSVNRGQNELDKLQEGRISDHLASDARGLSPVKALNYDGGFVDIPLRDGNDTLSTNNDIAFKENQQPLRRIDIIKQQQTFQKHDPHSDADFQNQGIGSRPVQNLPLDTQISKETMQHTIDANLLDSQSDSIDSLQTPTLHPLDTCSDVSFSYGGTTKLKTIRPLRAQLGRNATIATFSPASLPQSSPSTPSSPEMENPNSENISSIVPPKKELMLS